MWERESVREEVVEKREQLVFFKQRMWDPARGRTPGPYSSSCGPKARGPFGLSEAGLPLAKDLQGFSALGKMPPAVSRHQSQVNVSWGQLQYSNLARDEKLGRAPWPAFAARLKPVDRPAQPSAGRHSGMPAHFSAAQQPCRFIPLSAFLRTRSPSSIRHEARDQ